MEIESLIRARINDGRRISDGDALDAAKEIERLRGLLRANGIDPRSEYICRCGLRREPSRPAPDF